MNGPVEVPEADGGLIVHAKPGGTIVLAFSADVAPGQAREVVDQIAAGSPDARVIALADVTAVRSWHPDDAPAELAELREQLREIRADRDQLKKRILDLASAWEDAAVTDAARVRPTQLSETRAHTSSRCAAELRKELDA